MAGYLFALNNEDSLAECLEMGIYGTVISKNATGRWNPTKEATFADFVTMKSGDNVYFFIKRKIYGIGELLEIKSTNHGIADCKFCNYPNACEPKNPANGISVFIKPTDIRWVCTFKPSPYFFKIVAPSQNCSPLAIPYQLKVEG